MDPTVDLIKISDSFTTLVPTTKEIMNRLPEFYSAESKTLTPNIKVSPIKETSNLPSNSDICNVKEYEDLQEIKNIYYIDRNDKQAINEQTKIRNRANPFENIGHSIFMTRAGVKLANIDAIYNLTNSFGGLLRYRTDDRFSFATIADGPGAFTQYLQWRKSDYRGFGITLKGDSGSHLNWNRKLLNTKWMDFYDGEGGTGNLYFEWKSFVNKVLTEMPEGVHLVTGDGGFEVEDIDIPETTDPIERQALEMANYARQEFLSSRLFLVQILTAINCLMEHGKCVIKVFDTVTTLSAEILYLMSQAFEKIAIFKPITSRPGSAERYVIGINRVKNISFISDLLEKAHDKYEPGINLVSILKEGSLPNKFLRWLKKHNDISIKAQYTAAKNFIIQTNIEKNVYLTQMVLTPIEELKLEMNSWLKDNRLSSENFSQWLNDRSIYLEEINEDFLAYAKKNKITADKLLSQFIKWLPDQIEEPEHLLDAKYDLRKALILWHLPDNPLPRDNSWIRVQ